MTDGIRVEVTVKRPPGCVVASASRATGETVRLLDRTDGGDDVVLELAVPDGPPTLALPDLPAGPVEPIFGCDTTRIYRVHREADGRCPTDYLADAACPIVEARAIDGDFLLNFHAPDIERLQDLMDRLTTHFDVDMRRLLRSDADAPAESKAMVDRSRLTPRQRDVLATAHEMGYFEHPKRANASDVAAALSLSRPTVAEHLAAAQSKIFEGVLE